MAAFPIIQQIMTQPDGGGADAAEGIERFIVDSAINIWHRQFHRKVQRRSFLIWRRLAIPDFPEVKIFGTAAGLDDIGEAQ